MDGLLEVTEEEVGRKRERVGRAHTLLGQLHYCEAAHAASRSKKLCSSDFDTPFLFLFFHPEQASRLPSTAKSTNQRQRQFMNKEGRSGTKCRFKLGGHWGPLKSLVRGLERETSVKLPTDRADLGC